MQSVRCAIRNLEWECNALPIVGKDTERTKWVHDFGSSLYT